MEEDCLQLKPYLRKRFRLDKLGMNRDDGKPAAIRYSFRQKDPENMIMRTARELHVRVESQSAHSIEIGSEGQRKHLSEQGSQFSERI
ncbi:hypothetical protein Ciccas_009743 [Cichlidogyrus casuarinus]|uniref:Uncharacterized protein n=1 Tax=Cichlidogyrus casuarinus TaxID=1844966 RepID=A0ABD2PW47_9PLAT